MFPLALMPLLLAGCTQNMGIIGGADGPTAIFITADPGWPWLAALLLLAVLAAVGVVLLVRRKRRRK